MATQTLIKFMKYYNVSVSSMTNGRVPITYIFKLQKAIKSIPKSHRLYNSSMILLKRWRQSCFARLRSKIEQVTNAECHSSFYENNVFTDVIESLFEMTKKFETTKTLNGIK